MIIAIDYDETWTRDPEFWGEVVAFAVSRGHTVYGVTWRTAAEAELMDPNYLALKVFFSGGKAKRACLREHGLYADVWIDDMPASIDYTFGKVLEWP